MPTRRDAARYRWAWFHRFLWPPNGSQAITLEYSHSSHDPYAQVSSRTIGWPQEFVLDEWKYYNSALRRAKSRLDPHFLQSITQETTRRLSSNLKAKIAEEDNCIEILSIMELMKMITMDVFGQSAFSHDFGCCSKVELCVFAKAFGCMEADIMRRCTQYTLLPQNLFYWIPTRRNNKFHLISIAAWREASLELFCKHERPTTMPRTLSATFSRRTPR